MQTVVMKKKHSGVFMNADEQHTLTYSSISKKKSAIVKKGNQSIIEGFTPQQQADFDRGITIENYAKSRGIIL